MKSDFPFHVGDRVRLDNWVPDSFVTIKILGDEGFLFDSPAPDKGECYIEFDVRYKGRKRTWSLYAEPTTYPEMWIAIMPTRCVRISHRTAAAADPDVLGVLHLHTNGVVTMEAP